MAKLDCTKRVTITINNAEQLRVAIENLAAASRAIVTEWKQRMGDFSKSQLFVRFLAADDDKK